MEIERRMIRVNNRKTWVAMSKDLISLIDGERKIRLQPKKNMPWPHMFKLSRLSQGEEEGFPLEWVDEKGSPGLLTTDMLIPTLEMWAEAIRCENTEETESILPGWTRFQRMNRVFLQEVDPIILKWGVINGVAIPDPNMIKAIVYSLIMGWSGKDQVNALRQFANPDADTKYSWLFCPGVTSHLSPYAENARQERGAVGTFVLDFGEWEPRKLSNSEVGKAGLTAIKEGIACWMHPQGKQLTRGLAINFKNYPFVIIPEGDFNKPSKTLARGQACIGNSCRLMFPQKAGVRIKGIELNSGMEFKNILLVADAAIICGDGGGMYSHKNEVAAWIKIANEMGIKDKDLDAFLYGYGFTAKGIVVFEEHSDTIQLPTETKTNIKEGQLVLAGESLIGCDNILIAERESKILSIKEVTIEETTIVTVKYEIKIVTESPKGRGPGHKFTFHQDITNVLPSWLAGIFPGKTAMAGMSMFCWMNKIVIDLNDKNPAFPEDLRLMYDTWVESRTRSVKLTWEVSPKIADIAEAEGLTVTRKSRRECYITRKITGIYGDMLLEIESPITELRMTRTSLTLSCHIEIERMCKTRGEIINVPVFAMPKKFLSDEDFKDMAKLGFDASMELLVERYPLGVIISNDPNSLELECAEMQVAIDATAIKAFSSGPLMATDAVGIAFRNVLMANLNYIADKEALASHSQTKVGVEQSCNKLAGTLTYLRDAINGLALSGAILKRLVSGKRSAALATARTYDFIPIEEVWMSQTTADEAGTWEGEEVWIGRHPTPMAFSTKVRIHNELGFGIFAVNSLAMNVSNKGDADGDQIWLEKAARVPYLFGMNVKERENASRLICMMAWNRGIDIPATKRGVFDRQECQVPDYESLWHRDMKRYTEHLNGGESALSESPFGKALLGKKLTCVINQPVGPVLIDARIYPKSSEFGTSFVGMIFGAGENSERLSCYSINEKEENALLAAYILLGVLYEDAGLAGWTEERQAIMEALSVPANLKNFGERVAILGSALALNGFNAAIDGLDATRVIKAVLIAINMQRSLGDENGQRDKFQCFGYEQYIPICKSLRGLASGNKKLIISTEDWDKVYDFTFGNAKKEIPPSQPSNLYRKIIGSIVDVYTVITMILNARKEEGNEEVPE